LPEKQHKTLFFPATAAGVQEEEAEAEQNRKIMEKQPTPTVLLQFLILPTIKTL